MLLATSITDCLVQGEAHLSNHPIKKEAPRQKGHTLLITPLTKGVAVPTAQRGD